MRSKTEKFQTMYHEAQLCDTPKNYSKFRTPEKVINGQSHPRWKISSLASIVCLLFTMSRHVAAVN